MLAKSVSPPSSDNDIGRIVRLLPQLPPAYLHALADALEDRLADDQPRAFLRLAASDSR